MNSKQLKKLGRMKETNEESELRRHHIKTVSYKYGKAEWTQEEFREKRATEREF